MPGNVHFGRVGSCITPCLTGPCSADRELRWQQVPPDGEPPAAALEGTIWLMVSLVMAVRAGEWSQSSWSSTAEKGGYMVHSVSPAPRLWNLPLARVVGSSFPFLRTEAQLASQDPAPCCWSFSLSPSGCLSFWIPWAVSLGICAAAQLTWGGGRRTDLLSPRYHPYPLPVPGRH